MKRLILSVFVIVFMGSCMPSKIFFSFPAEEKQTATSTLKLKNNLDREVSFAIEDGQIITIQPGESVKLKGVKNSSKIQIRELEYECKISECSPFLKKEHPYKIKIEIK